MITYSELYKGCKNEQQFKNLYCKKAPLASLQTCFNIETEETCKGFPDVLAIDKKAPYSAVLLEFKYAHNGIIKFQPTQPSFYKKYGDNVLIYVIAYNPSSKRIHEFEAKEILNEQSDYFTHGKATINLNTIEHKYYRA